MPGSRANRTKTSAQACCSCVTGHIPTCLPCPPHTHPTSTGRWLLAGTACGANSTSIWLYSTVSSAADTASSVLSAPAAGWWIASEHKRGAVVWLVWAHLHQTKAPPHFAAVELSCAARCFRPGDPTQLHRASIIFPAPCSVSHAPTCQLQRPHVVDDGLADQVGPAAKGIVRAQQRHAGVGQPASRRQQARKAVRLLCMAAAAGQMVSARVAGVTSRGCRSPCPLDTVCGSPHH